MGGSWHRHGRLFRWNNNWALDLSVSVFVWRFGFFGDLEILTLKSVSRLVAGNDKSLNSFIDFLLLCARALQVTPTDGLPAVVCCQCRDQLDGFYRFRENALTVERRLKDYLSNTKQLAADSSSSSEVSGPVFTCY